MYIKKIIASVALVATVAVSAAMFAAFEAHVINVTAKIENALNVDTTPINFGTVFPQEELDRYLDISLSDSFITEGRVDDVEYIIRQKPKCGWTLNDGELLLGLPTMTGHVNPDGSVTCPDSEHVGVLPDGAQWGQLPLLCPYLSKHKALNDPDENQNEVEIDAFHQPWTIDPSGAVPGVVYLDAEGRLAKSDGDYEDNWVIDLKVPCFGDHCAQDWADFVTDINPDAIPADYVQPIANEHKIFGCDLWIEVTRVSEWPIDEPVCGNYVVEGNEECDDGPSGSPVCTPDCIIIPEPFCGDGNIDPGEECDDGLLNGPYPFICSELCEINHIPT